MLQAMPSLHRSLLGSMLVVVFACGGSGILVPSQVQETPTEVSEPDQVETLPDDQGEPEEPEVEGDAGITLEPDGGVVVPRARRLSRPTLRVMTYNIKKGHVSSLADVADVIRKQKPDLVAMQEVGAGSPNQGKRLGDMLGMRSAFVNADNATGNAVLSRFKIEDANGILLPSTSLQRALLITRFDLDGQNVRFGSTHLAHDSHFDRMNQMHAVLDRMNGQNFQLLAGDFNAHAGKSPEVLEMVNKAFNDAWKLGGEGPAATAPALDPSPGVRIDHIMLGQGYVSRVRAFVPFAPTQSDHRPVVATMIKPWSQSLLGDWLPETKVADPTGAVELGLRVKFDKAGVVEGVRFYRGARNAEGYRINLWTADGKLLSTAQVADSAEDGWIEAGFRAPFRVKPDTVYVVSYFSSNGRFSKTGGLHANRMQSGNVIAPGTDNGGNGVQAFGATTRFPSMGSENGNAYFVDVRFRPDP
jgi:endonuclease/exonuclease/phosphatase family metal-dependent hydrolase